MGRANEKSVCMIKTYHTGGISTVIPKLLHVYGRQRK